MLHYKFKGILVTKGRFPKSVGAFTHPTSTMELSQRHIPDGECGLLADARLDNGVVGSNHADAFASSDAAVFLYGQRMD